MTFFEWVQTANHYRIVHPNQREGQAFSNALQEFKPELRDCPAIKEVDCFFADEQLSSFVEAVKDNWEWTAEQPYPVIEVETEEGAEPYFSELASSSETET